MSSMSRPGRPRSQPRPHAGHEIRDSHTRRDRRPEGRVALVRNAFDNPACSEERANDTHGAIEPVGTHADDRRRGFAGAVIRECFVRMQEAGIQQVEIASRVEPDISNHLDDSLLPASKREVHKYRK